MIKISDGTEQTYWENASKIDVSKLTNLKFRAKDAPFSRRQVNAISESDLLVEKRKNSKGWRSFTFKELVYLLILKELKDFSLESKQLIGLKESFFKSKNNDFDKILLYFLAHIQIFIIIRNDFKAYFTDLPMFSDVVEDCEKYICIDFNEVVNQFLEKLGVEKYEPIIKTHNQYIDKLLEAVEGQPKSI